MADKTAIEWTQGDDGTPGATWNPITGCSVTSPGCAHCYAMRLGGTRLQHHPSRAGLTTPSAAGPVWNGHVRLNEEWLDQPLRWKRPRRIFVCAHSDLFHENVPDEWIDRVFATMHQAPWHTYQVLTKRSLRMRLYIESRADKWSYVLPTFPAPHIWLGVSAEDQRRADERIPHLLATPAAVRFLSVEPMLEAIDLSWSLSRSIPEMAAGFLARGHFSPGGETLRPLDWVICGGESGPNARDMNPDWSRSLRDQCAEASVPFFMKQMARKAEIPPELMVRQWPERAHA